MQHVKVDPVKRILAFLIDGLVSIVPVFIPFIGGLLGTIYILTKDSLIYELTKQEEWKNRSIGKKVLGLEVVKLDGTDLDLADSVKRNLPLAIGNLISIIPLIGWLIGPLVGLGLAAIELLFLVTDPLGRRYGDRFAETQVIASAKIPSKQELPDSTDLQ